MAEAFLVDAVRTPVGRRGGGLAGVHPAISARMSSRRCWPAPAPTRWPSTTSAPLVSQLGGYPTLFLSVAVITVFGSAFVWKIRSVP